MRTGGAAGGALLAQQTDRSGRPRIVSLFATVTDAQNRLVPDLGRTTSRSSTTTSRSRCSCSTTRCSRSGRRDARHERQHDRLDRAPEEGRRAVSAAAPARRQGHGRRVQRQDRSGDVASRTIAISSIAEVKDLDFGNGTRLYDAIDEGLDAAPRRWTGASDPRLHRRRRHIEPRRTRHRAGSRARRRSDDLCDRPESEYFDGERMVRSKPDGGLKTLGRRDRRRLFRAEENHATSGRPSRASRRNYTASTCSASRPSSSTAKCTSCR